MIMSIYARESSDDTNKAPPIEKQIEIGRTYAQENGHEVRFLFQDNGYSGGDWNRPDWKKAVQEAKGKHYNILWTWNQDRLARDTEQFLFFFRNMKENSIRVISGTEGEINMDDVGGMAKHTSLAMAAEIFRRVTSEKVKRTYENKKKNSKIKGIPMVWGRKLKDVDLNKILELRASGKGYKAIGRELGLNYQLVRRRLRNTPTEDRTELTEIEGGQNNPIK